MTIQARAVETRKAILAAAAEVFLRHGFAGASLSEIATLAGVTKGALYFHFPSKSALSTALIMSQRDANDAFRDYVESYEGDHLKLLREMTHGLVRRVTEEPMLRAALRLAVEQGRDSDTAHTYDEWEGLVARVARIGQERGEVTDVLSPERIARFLVASFTGFQTVSSVSVGLTDLRERVDDMWTLLYPSLAPR